MSVSTRSADYYTGPQAGPMTLDEGKAAFAQLQHDRPDLFVVAPPPGKRRGIDVYEPHSLQQVFRVACNNFHEAHNRYPDLVHMPTTADHFFATKFFHSIPMRPNPADKLAASAYMSQKMLRRVGVPRRVWISDEPCLPKPNEVPPGTYWLKISNGHERQRRVVWPPKADERKALEDIIQIWWCTTHGVIWGEWWYKLVKPRLFLECDLSHLMADRPEIKIFVREGEVKLLYAVRLREDKRHEQAYFDTDLRPLPGRSTEYRPLKTSLPDTIELMLEAAAEVGRRFRLVRVDFLNAAGPLPYFVEITLCHNNARQVLFPPSFDDWVRRRLFE